MHKLQRLIKSGSKSFLITEYLYLCVWVVLVFAVLIVIFSIDAAQLNATAGVRIACAFLLGAGLSAASGWFGMMVATDANIRTTWAADKDGLNSALQVAFTGGSCMGFVVSGLGLAGIAVCYIIMALGYDANTPTQAQMQSISSLTGFGFGASSIALFARVAGGIFTKVRGGGGASEAGRASEAGKRAKRASERSEFRASPLRSLARRRCPKLTRLAQAADVGADLVGKVEAGIPEDDPRNPAVIADNVGDNVGDVAGMGADLFESFVGSIIAAATLANGDIAKISLPFWVSGGGVLASLIGKEAGLRSHTHPPSPLLTRSTFLCNPGYFFVSCPPNASQKQLMFALHKGVFVASALTLGLSALWIYLLFNYDPTNDSLSNVGWPIYACIVIGLFCGLLIAFATEVFTSCVATCCCEGAGGRGGSSAASAILVRGKRAESRAVGGRPPEPPPRPARSRVRTCPPSYLLSPLAGSCAGAGGREGRAQRARFWCEGSGQNLGLSGGDPPNPPRGRRGCTCAHAPPLTFSLCHSPLVPFARGSGTITTR
jgi:inorganic pyrophosphatase